MEKNKTIHIATGNKSKLEEYSLYLGDKYSIKSNKDLDIVLDVKEGIIDIESNAILKAKSWCSVTGMTTIGDDTGFFIHELNGEPGVATRRWAGELGEEATNEEFWRYLQFKTKNLKDYSCHFEQCVAIVTPDGKEKIIKNIINGTLNKEKLSKSYNGSSYPLGAAFEYTDYTKDWDLMSDVEKKTAESKFIESLNSALLELNN